MFKSTFSKSHSLVPYSVVVAMQDYRVISAGNEPLALGCARAQTGQVVRLRPLMMGCSTATTDVLTWGQLTEYCLCSLKTRLKGQRGESDDEPETMVNSRTVGCPVNGLAQAVGLAFGTNC